MTITGTDDAPVLEAADTVSIAEGTASADQTVTALTVTDPDTDYTVGDFTITGDNASKFAVQAVDAAQGMFALVLKSGKAPTVLIIPIAAPTVLT